VYWLAAPVRRVNMGAALIAYSPPLEDEVLPNVGRITQAVRAVLAE
jgi:pyruvate/2-oxoglutarate/acetoin dehydrogenase E1 component